MPHQEHGDPLTSFSEPSQEYRLSSSIVMHTRGRPIGLTDLPSVLYVKMFERVFDKEQS